MLHACMLACIETLSICAVNSQALIVIYDTGDAISTQALPVLPLQLLRLHQGQGRPAQGVPGLLLPFLFPF